MRGIRSNGKDPLGAGRVAVDVEGDAQLQQQALGRLLAALQLAVVERLDGVEQQPRLGARLARRVEHLVVEAVGVVPGHTASNLTPESLVSLDVPPAAGTYSFGA